MGKTFNRQKRGEELADYAKNSLESVKKTVRFLPNEKRPKVYLAMDADGLSTSCRGGMRSYFIEAAGGFNVYECPSTIIN
jgi:iron complex transport system substrate-binding protein